MPQDLSRGRGNGGVAPERNSCKHIHKTAAGGSASAAMHRLSDSIVFPNKHRHPLKWNKHKQRVKGTVNRGVVCPLGLGSGGRRSAGTYEKKRLKERRETKGSKRGLMAATMTFWCLRPVSKGQDGDAALALCPMTFTPALAFLGYLASTCCRVCWIHTTLTKEVLKHDCDHVY